MGRKLEPSSRTTFCAGERLGRAELAAQTHGVRQTGHVCVQGAGGPSQIPRSAQEQDSLCVSKATALHDPELFRESTLCDRSLVLCQVSCAEIALPCSGHIRYSDISSCHLSPLTPSSQLAGFPATLPPQHCTSQVYCAEFTQVTSTYLSCWYKVDHSF